MITVTMWEDRFSMNDIIKKLHEEGVTGLMDFRKVKFTVCHGMGEPYVKVEYPQDKSENDFF